MEVRLTHGYESERVDATSTDLLMESRGQLSTPPVAIGRP